MTLLATGCDLVVGSDPGMDLTGEGASGAGGPSAEGGGDPSGGGLDGATDDGAAGQDGASGLPPGTDPTSTPDSQVPRVDASAARDSSASTPDAATRDGGTADAPTSPAEGGGPTSGADATADAPSTGGGGEGGASCGPVAPPGWTAVLFDTGLEACPAGFTEHVVLGAPSVAAGACSCACTVTQAGVCDRGSLVMTAAPGHGVDTCSSPWFTANITGSGCVAVPPASQQAFDSYQAAPLSATGQGGTCSSQPTPNAAALSEPPQRYCDVPAANADAVCAGDAPAGFSACIVAPGQVACPASTPFTHPFTVEQSAALSCGSCGACSVSTTCDSPTVQAFTNATCAGAPAFSFAANNTCVGGAAEQAFSGVAYHVSANATCSAGSSTASVELTGAQTICCR